MKIKPFGVNILIKPIEKEQILVGDRKSLCEYGTVIAVGDDVKNVKVGMVIGYTVWGVNHLEIDNERHYFIPEDGRFILGELEMSGDLVA